MCVRKIVFTTLLMSSLLVGCTATDDAAEGYENEINQLTEEVTELKTVIAAQEDKIDSLENFSYLNDFTEEELKAYDLFLEEYDVTQLKNYSPEKIVLLYLHSLATGDVDTIHAIAYDGGTLTDLDTLEIHLTIRLQMYPRMMWSCPIETMIPLKYVKKTNLKTV